jgi:hypothetical protein
MDGTFSGADAPGDNRNLIVLLVGIGVLIAAALIYFTTR